MKNMFISWGRKEERGFFLIEACLALVLISIILLAVVPAWISVQQKLENAHQRAVSLIAVQNEVEKFHQYMEDGGVKQVILDGYPYHISWVIREQGDLEEGRLQISWDLSAHTSEQVEYRLLRLKKEFLPVNMGSP